MNLKVNDSIGEWTAVAQARPRHVSALIPVLLCLLNCGPQEARLEPLVIDSGLLSNATTGICGEPEGAALWLGTRGGGAIRYDLESGSLTTYTTADGLPDNDVLAICAEPGGAAIWFGTDGGGASRYDLKSKSFTTYTTADGLPDNSVLAISAEPSAEAWGAAIWVRTRRGGASRYDLKSKSFTTCDTAGPVNALAALADGSVFLAYNAIAPKVILVPGLAALRAQTHVRYVSAKGDPVEIILHQAPQAEIRALAVSTWMQRQHWILDGREFTTKETILWAATSAGLFKIVNPERKGAAFEPVTAVGLSVPLQLMRVDDTGAIWVTTDRQGDAPPAVIGYRPRSETTLALTRDNGIPEGDRIDDIDFTEDGELVVLVGSRLVKGRVRVGQRVPWNELSIILVLTFSAIAVWLGVFRHPLVVRLRAHPETLGELPLTRIPTALRRLRWARALPELCKQLHLSDARLTALESLADGPPDAHRLRTLAAHLGMEGADAAPVDELHPGLLVLAADLPDPGPLRGVPTPIVGFDPESARGVDPAALRDKIAGTLRELGHRFELPFLVLCRDPGAARELIPEGRVTLILGEDELRQLLFARSPRQVLAGLLLTRDLLALSPYRPEGEVKTPAMFYGRSRLLRELMTADPLHFLLVGPRRVGKSSVLRRLRDVLPVNRPEVELVHLDLLGISEPGRVLRKLAGKLELPAPADADTADEHAEVLTALLTERFAGGVPGVLLIDEADGLVEVDAGRGYPLLSTLRTLQAEGVCSCVVAGYWHLYRRTLDHGSPLYNFAPVRRLGPLDPQSGRDLATEPMGRLGLRWADSSLPERLVERTGGYPNLIQLVCHQLIVELRQGRTMTLTAEHLERAERSSQVRDYLSWSFGINALPAAQVMVDGLIERDAFTVAEAHACLERAVDREVPIGVLDQLLIQLVLYGFVTRSEAGYGWTIPLLRETLVTAEDRGYRVRRLVGELPPEPSAWAVTADESSYARG